MKKPLRPAALLLAVLLLAACLTSCQQGLSGRYDESDDPISFSGGEWQLVVSAFEFSKKDALSVTAEFQNAAYKISCSYTLNETENGKTITVKFLDAQGGGIAGYLISQVVRNSLEATFPFEEGKDDRGSYIVFNGARYYKK